MSTTAEAKLLECARLHASSAQVDPKGPQEPMGKASRRLRRKSKKYAALDLPATAKSAPETRQGIAGGERFWRAPGAKIAKESPERATRGYRSESGFTLLEVLVSLTVLAVGAALTLSLISGSLGNIRKVQQRTRTVEHAEAVMELALLDDSIQEPTSFTGDFEDGTRWSVRVEDYELPTSDRLPPRNSPQTMQAKLLCYTVEMFSPESRGSDYRLQTLKLVRTTPQDQRPRIR